MKWKLLTLTLLLCLSFAKPVFAVENPTEVANNKFGIHIHDENDLIDASNLLNSSGGDWGYVTIVIRDDQRKVQEWQATFDRMRKIHLIPIVRIASKSAPQYWEKADPDQIDDWVNFLKSLTWVTKNRYIIVGNEPNHAAEWGGSANPEEYSDYLLNFAQQLKKASPDFFVMSAGIDASAPTNSDYMDEGLFLTRMIKKNPKLFDSIDGWSSHSYPNPGFAGAVTDTGRGSIRTFDWELTFLKTLGVTKTLPVFITETGWTHPLEDSFTEKKQDDYGKKLQLAYDTAWNDPRVVAVTPFILNYQSPPFDMFSWKKKTGEFYSFYELIKSLPKVKGEPKIENSGEISAILLPEVITLNDTIYGLAYVKNTGEKIWASGVTQQVDIEGGQIELTPTNPLSDIEPGAIGTVLYRDISPQKQTGKTSMQLPSFFDTIGLASHVLIAQR